MDRRRFTALVLVAGSAGTVLARPRPGQAETEADADTPRERAHGVAQVPLAPGVNVQKLNLARLVYFDKWSWSVPYSRYQQLLVWTGSSASVEFSRRSFNPKLKERFLPARRYTLVIDGVERASCDMAAGQVSGEFKLATASLPGGWLELDIGGLADGEGCPHWFAFMLREGTVPSKKMPVCTGSYDLAAHTRETGEHAWVWVPAAYQPAPSPLAPTPHPHFSDTASDLVMQPMGYHAEGNPRFPNVDRRGIVNAFDRQSYFYSDFISRYPRLALLDGPRGVGALSMPTHIDVGVATRDPDPASPPRLNIYVTDPWRLVRVTDTGEITTLAGWRHKGMASHWADTESGTRQGNPGATLELVGDWSAIPPKRRGFHELWGMCWDRVSLVPDATAARIPSEDNRQPHIGNPVCFLTDSQNNRVCRIEFDGKRHATPAKVTEFLVDLEDPWDIVAWKGSVIVSERASHRIVQYDIKSGALQRVVVSGKALATIDKTHRRAKANAPLGDLQAQPCVAPEGLYVLDDWLYFGSFAQRQVRRVHLATGKLEIVVAEMPLSGNSKFVKLAVSDGTFGPREAVFIQSWANAAPKTGHLPGGKQWKLQAQGFNVSGYGTAVAIRNGRMYFGNSRYGIWRIAKGAPMDVRLFRQGEDEYHAAHYKLTHGTGGLGHFGYPLPWGKSAAIDYYLELSGHTPPCVTCTGTEQRAGSVPLPRVGRRPTSRPV